MDGVADAVGAVVAAYGADHPPLESLPGIGDGYAVQAAVVGRLCELWATSVSGYKLSFTVVDPPSQGLASAPAYGRILDRQLEPSGAILELTGEPLVETELLFRAEDRLTAGMTPAELVERMTVRPMFEVPASRFRDWWPDRGAPRISRAEFIADNCLARQVVTGGAWLPAAAVRPDDVAVTLTCPDGSSQDGHSSDVMGSPVTALAWLLQRLGHIEQGTIVASGTITTPVRASAGTYAADFGDRLGRLSVTFA